MASVTRESIGNLHDKLTVKLEKQDYYPSFEKEIRSVSKKANIPGFRKGMVPAGMIRKMYGKQLYTDTVLQSAENELRNYLIDEKIDVFGQPLFLNDPENFPEIDMQEPKEYEFNFEIGLRPDVAINIPETASATLYKVKVKPEDIDNRIDNFQAQFGELKEVDVIDNPENVIYVTIAETDESGELKEEGFSEDTSVYVKIFNKEFQDQLMGKKKDDTISGVMDQMISPKDYPGIYERLKINAEDAEKTGVNARVTITEVNVLEKPAIDEELFKKAYPNKEIKTEEEFRKAIEEEEQKYWDDTANNRLEHSLYHILEDIPVELPEDFLKKMLNDPQAPRTKEEIEQQYPSFASQLKWSMISAKIIEDQDLKVTQEELRQSVLEQLKQYFGGSSLAGLGDDDSWLDSYVDRMMTDQKQIEQQADKLMSGKIFDWARTVVKINEEEISQEDFKAKVEEHNHHHH